MPPCQQIVLIRYMKQIGTETNRESRFQHRVELHGLGHCEVV